MNQIIKLDSRDIGGDVVQAVNARDLHAFLEVGRDFSNWIKDRIAQYDFVERHDYVTAQNLSTPKSVSTKARAQLVIDYYLSLDMAKELAMVERNEKGKQARQYFIECERRAKSAAIDPMQALSDPAMMRGLLLTYTEKVIALESVVAEQAPKVEALDRIASSEGSLCVMDAAKSLQIQPKKLFAWLSENRWLYRRPGGPGWIAYQDKIQAGLLEHKVTTVQRNDGSDKTTEQARVTPKGLVVLAKKLGGDDLFSAAIPGRSIRSSGQAQGRVQ